VGDELIYHYTGLKGLMGIIEEHQVWATNVRFLNDTGESTFGVERLRELVIGDVKTRHDPHGYLRTFGKLIKRTPWMQEPFVTCFCRNDDLLSQWRSYGRLGYAIGFDRETFASLHGGPVAGFALREMIYSKRRQADLVHAVIDQFVERVVTPPFNPSVEPIEIAEWYAPLSVALFQLLPAFKHKAFREEHEVRSESWHTDEDLHFRETILGPTPYIITKIDDTEGRSTIRTVRVGPTPHPEEAILGVQKLLARSGHDDVIVLKSDTPFRWQ
jgi:hypothetical protein